ncbi:hypothetical protein C8035_v003697 [Colletotrichum spinosum]|uniref:Uncharacterized protein n=1 Tax=Colletotrichum spinosum TaxID=1347390 RepID=A0A4R8QMB0_9PEZI|nr:hypothetical protein C8035_v003697 [Colletotrichum spinosum]
MTMSTAQLHGSLGLSSSRPAAFIDAVLSGRKRCSSVPDNGRSLIDQTAPAHTQTLASQTSRLASLHQGDGPAEIPLVAPLCISPSPSSHDEEFHQAVRLSLAVCS